MSFCPRKLWKRQLGVTCLTAALVFVLGASISPAIAAPGPSFEWRDGRRARSLTLAEHELGLFLERDVAGARGIVDALLDELLPGAQVIDDNELVMTLTGELIIHVDPSWEASDVEAWLDGRADRGRSFSYAPGAWLLTAPAVDLMASLELANELYRLDAVTYAYPNWLRAMSPRTPPDDPLYIDQWHLENTGQDGCSPGEDINVATVWDRYRGTADIRVAVVDDGLEVGHEDLVSNIVAGASWDFLDSDPDPTAGRHGTAVAGVSAARGFNAQGVTGVAPEAGLVGFRILGGRTDVIEADALTRDYALNDIYNNSWGPADDGQRLEGPGPLTLLALADGVRSGRGGLGSIYVWAGGNGGKVDDNTNYDGYVSSRYTVGVGASGCSGEWSTYSDQGATVLVSAPSDQSFGPPPYLTTTDRTGALGYSTGEYTPFLTGTSAAAPVVSGVVTLMLDANPGLGWRDVQAILLTTAEMNDPAEVDWTVNGAGLPVSHKYGFGRVDAAAAVAASESWPNLAPEVSVTELSAVGQPIPDGPAPGLSDSIEIVDSIRVESVEVVFSASDHDRWGDLDVTLIAPSGTISRLAVAHATTDPTVRYDDWRFGSVRHWGEDSKGAWRLLVSDAVAGNIGTLTAWRLTLYGTEPDTIPPAEVTGLLATDIDGRDLQLNWDAVTLDELGGPETVGLYEIWRADSRDLSTLALYASSSATRIVIADEIAPGSGPGYYQVRARDTAGNLGR